MKNKKQVAQQIESFLEEEFTKNLPVVKLQDNSIAYKNYKIKQNKRGDFDLKFGGLGFETIGNFNLKVCALMAAKKHDKCQLEAYNEVRDLDSKYWASYADAKYFQYKRKITKDFEKFEILTSRYDISSKRAVDYKDKITRMFRSTF